MAASIREWFGANFTRALDELKSRKIDHQDVARTMGVPLTRISTYKKGTIPDPAKLNAFCNTYGIQPSSLFVDPSKRGAPRRPVSQDAVADMIEVMRVFLESQGFEVTKKKP